MENGKGRRKFQNPPRKFQKIPAEFLKNSISEGRIVAGHPEFLLYFLTIGGGAGPYKALRRSLKGDKLEFRIIPADATEARKGRWSWPLDAKSLAHPLGAFAEFPFIRRLKR